MTETQVPPTSLCDILAHEQQQLDMFLALLAQEQDAIRSLSFDEMTAVTSAKCGILEALRKIEEQRVAWIARVASEWSLPAETLTIGAIAERAEPRVAVELRNRHEQLQATLAAVRRTGTLTEALLDGSLAFLNDCLSAWRQVVASVPLYASSGTMQAEASGGSLLARKG